MTDRDLHDHLAGGPVRGEVWWYEHPAASARPVLVLTRSAACPVLNQLLAVPATRTVRGIPTEVSLGADHGMPVDCVLTLDNVTLVRPEFCTTRITVLDTTVMHQVCRALADATDC